MNKFVVKYMYVKCTSDVIEAANLEEALKEFQHAHPNSPDSIAYVFDVKQHIVSDVKAAFEPVEEKLQQSKPVKVPETQESSKAASVKMSTNIIGHGNTILDLTLQGVFVDDKYKQLSCNEFIVLSHLFEDPDIPQDDDKLLKSLYGEDSYMYMKSSKSLGALMSRNRKKLSSIGSNLIIEKIRGVGYVLKVK